MTLKKIGDFLNYPWMLLLGGAILSPIFTDWYTKVPFTTSFISIYHWIIKWAVIILTFKIQVWIICVTILMTLCVGIYLKYRKDSRVLVDGNGEFTVAVLDTVIDEENTKTYKLTKTFAYTADKFFNFTWEWKWVYNDRIKIYEPKYLAPCCSKPECNFTPLSNSSYGITSTFYCRKCAGFQNIECFEMDGLENTVIRYIEEKVAKF